MFADRLGFRSPPAFDTALLTAAIQGVFSTRAPDGDSPSKIMGTLNSAIIRRSVDCRFATIFYAIVRPDGTVQCYQPYGKPGLLVADLATEPDVDVYGARHDRGGTEPHRRPDEGVGYLRERGVRQLQRWQQGRDRRGSGRDHGGNVDSGGEGKAPHARYLHHSVSRPAPSSRLFHTVAPASPDSTPQATVVPSVVPTSAFPHTMFVPQTMLFPHTMFVPQTMLSAQAASCVKIAEPWTMFVPQTMIWDQAREVPAIVVYGSIAACCIWALVPLLWALDEYERYVIVLVDSEQARFVSAYLGRATTEDAMTIDFDDYDFRNLRYLNNSRAAKRGQPMAQGATSDIFEDMRSEHVRRFHRDVAEQIRTAIGDTHASRIVLGGNEQAAHQVRDLLHDPLKAKVIDILAIPMQADDHIVADAIQQAARRPGRGTAPIVEVNCVQSAVSHEQNVAGGRVLRSRSSGKEGSGLAGSDREESYPRVLGPSGGIVQVEYVPAA